MNWYKQSAAAYREGVCHTDEERKQGYAELPADKKRQAIDHLRRVIKPADLDTLKSRHTANPDKWLSGQHFFWGMSIRNSLREAGMGEKFFGIDNLDCIYDLLLIDLMFGRSETCAKPAPKEPVLALCALAIIGLVATVISKKNK